MWERSEHPWDSSTAKTIHWSSMEQKRSEANIQEQLSHILQYISGLWILCHRLPFGLDLSTATLPLAISSLGLTSRNASLKHWASGKMVGQESGVPGTRPGDAWLELLVASSSKWGWQCPLCQVLRVVKKSILKEQVSKVYSRCRHLSKVLAALWKAVRTQRSWALSWLWTLP